MLSHSVMSDSLQPHGLWPTSLLCPWDSPGKNTGVGCPFILQGILLTQETETESLASLVLAGGLFTTVPTGNPLIIKTKHKKHVWSLPTPGLCSSLGIDVSQEKSWKCRRKKKEEMTRDFSKSPLPSLYARGLWVCISELLLLFLTSWQITSCHHIVNNSWGICNGKSHGPSKASHY